MTDKTSAAREHEWVPKAKYDQMVALLNKAVESLDIATDALAAGTKMPDRAVLTAKLATATKDLRVAVGEALTDDEGRHHA